MNPDLQQLQPYPFERLAALKAGVVPAEKPPIALSIGEPRHPTPEIIRQALRAELDAGLATYPTTRGLTTLRTAVADWLQRRFSLPDGSIDPERQVLPVAGTREALFAFAQAVVDRHQPALVAMPNPF
jgi:N-succinyldiaminopimelate aminotransferase